MPIPVGGYDALAGRMLALYEEAELVMIRRVARRLARGITAPGEAGRWAHTPKWPC